MNYSKINIQDSTKDFNNEPRFHGLCNAHDKCQWDMNWPTIANQETERFDFHTKTNK